MPIEVPQTLPELREHVAKGNPVNIAGYGRESTHKGYLQWIFSSERWSGAKEVLRLLLTKNGYKYDTSSVTKTECHWEQPFGERRKIDLVVTAFNGDKELFRVPIELKTDSGTYGDENSQFETFDKYVRSNKDIAVPFAFLLGKIHVSNHCKWIGFKEIGPDTIFDIWKDLYDTSPVFIKDWLEAVSCEIARKQLAHEAYTDWKPRWNEKAGSDYGYRAPKDLMYYLLHLLMQKLRNYEYGDKWLLYDVRYNSVLNLDTCKYSNRQVENIPHLQWFYEFNDDRFALKGWIDPHKINGEKVRNWALNKREEIINIVIPGAPTTCVNSPIKLNGQSFTIAFWDMNFTDIDIIPDIAMKIMEKLHAKALK